MRCQTSRSYITLWILFSSHSTLTISVSYNLWISADHRCWLVGWGAFLIKRQMSGGGILTVWHYKSWHRFKMLCFAMLSHAPERKNQCKVQFTPPKLLTLTVWTIITFLITFVPTSVLHKRISSSGRGQRLDWVWEMQHYECWVNVYHSDSGI